MKFFKTLALTALAFTSLTVCAQTADEIVAKNTEAMGGAAKLGSLNTIKRTGNMSMQGMDIPVTLTGSQMQGARVDIEVMGTSNYQIVTPEKAIMFFPVQQMTEPKELDAEATAGMQSQLDIQGALFNYKQKGSTIEYGGTEKVEGADAYKIVLKNKSGKTANYFIDTKTNRLVKSSSKMKGADGSETEMETTFSDWKQNKDGYWFPYTTTTPNGPITFDTIETNVTVDPNIYKP